MAKKANKPAVKQVRTPKAKRAIERAFDMGLKTSNAYESFVALLASTFTPLRDAKGNSLGVKPEETDALRELGLLYKYGYMAGYFASNVPGWAKRKGNQTPLQVSEQMETIYSKPYPESSKPGRRTAIENKACRAADASLAAAKARTGLSNPNKRRPRPSANKAPEPPRELVAATPTLKTKEAVNDHFATAFAALLGTVNLNAKRVSPQLSTIVQDAYAGMVKLGLIKPSK